jgi:hypothetical protein
MPQNRDMEETHTLMTQVRFLTRGDVCLGSGFVVQSVSKGLRTPKGKHDVVGTYPGDDAPRTHQWSSYTNIRVRRA